MAALCWSSREEMPHGQGKRNPSKMVAVVRGKEDGGEGGWPGEGVEAGKGRAAKKHSLHWNATHMGSLYQLCLNLPLGPMQSHPLASAPCPGHPWVRDFKGPLEKIHKDSKAK